MYTCCITASKPLSRCVWEARTLLVLAARIWKPLQHRAPLAVRNRLMISSVSIVMANLYSFVLCTCLKLLFFLFCFYTLVLDLKRMVMSFLSLGFPSVEKPDLCHGQHLLPVHIIYFFNTKMAKESCMQQPCEVSTWLSMASVHHFLSACFGNPSPEPSCVCLLPSLARFGFGS